jgi:hypothetical protein
MGDRSGSAHSFLSIDNSSESLQTSLNLMKSVLFQLHRNPLSGTTTDKVVPDRWRLGVKSLLEHAIFHACCSNEIEDLQVNYVS